MSIKGTTVYRAVIDGVDMADIIHCIAFPYISSNVHNMEYVSGKVILFDIMRRIFYVSDKV
jgi:hypothetical protein